VLFKRFGIKRILTGATAISSALIITKWSYLRLWEFGISLTWLVALPSWLLGCLLADDASRGNLTSRTQFIWRWRLLALLYTSFANFAVFHLPINLGCPATMLVFSFYCYFWLKRELYFLASSNNLIFEWAGTWSYSMYLIHNMILVLYSLHYSPGMVVCLLQLVSIFVASYAFYLVVERPSHLLAQYLGRAVRRPRSVAVQS
jgi:peptidoglycan/LPS O-acetylase OafA/YrhL